MLERAALKFRILSIGRVISSYCDRNGYDLNVGRQYSDRVRFFLGRRNNAPQLGRSPLAGSHSMVIRVHAIQPH